MAGALPTSDVSKKAFNNLLSHTNEITYISAGNGQHF